MLEECPVLGWAASGGMALTGAADGAPSASPAPAFGLLCAVAGELAAVTRATGVEVRADPGELVAGRAGLAGVRRRGGGSAGGSAGAGVGGWFGPAAARGGRVVRGQPEPGRRRGGGSGDYRDARCGRRDRRGRASERASGRASGRGGGRLGGARGGGA